MVKNTTRGAKPSKLGEEMEAVKFHGQNEQSIFRFLPVVNAI